MALPKLPNHTSSSDVAVVSLGFPGPAAGHRGQVPMIPIPVPPLEDGGAVEGFSVVHDRPDKKDQKKKLKFVRPHAHAHRRCQPTRIRRGR